MSEETEMRTFRTILKGKDGKLMFRNGMTAIGEFEIEIIRPIDNGICGT